MEETKLRKKLLDEGIANNKPELIEILQYLRYLDGKYWIDVLIIGQ